MKIYDYLSLWNLVFRQMIVHFRLPLIIIVFFSRQLGIAFSQVTAFHILCTMGNLAANNVLLIIGIFSKENLDLETQGKEHEWLANLSLKISFTSAVIFQWLYVTWHDMTWQVRSTIYQFLYQQVLILTACMSFYLI